MLVCLSHMSCILISTCNQFAGLSVCIMCSVSFSHSEKKSIILNFDINFKCALTMFCLINCLITKPDKLSEKIHIFGGFFTLQTLILMQSLF